MALEGFCEMGGEVPERGVVLGGRDMADSEGLEGELVRGEWC